MATTYSIKKTSELEASLVLPAFAMTTFVVAFTKLTPKTYGWAAVTSGVSISSPTGTVVDNEDGTFSISTLGTFTIVFTDDGVYKVTVTITGTGAGTGTHYTLINYTLKSLLETQLANNIYCFPEIAYDCSDKTNAVYNTNILCLLSDSYFVDDINMAFNYNVVSSGVLHKDFKYTCTEYGGGSADFTDASSNILLMDEDFNAVGASSLTYGKTYTCIYSGTPADYDGTIVSPYNTEMSARFNSIADAIDRVDEYRQTCGVTNTCSC